MAMSRKAALAFFQQRFQESKEEGHVPLVCLILPPLVVLWVSGGLLISFIVDDELTIVGAWMLAFPLGAACVALLFGICMIVSSFFPRE
jgi:hypothetical protein